MSLPMITKDCFGDLFSTGQNSMVVPFFDLADQAVPQKIKFSGFQVWPNHTLRKDLITASPGDARPSPPNPGKSSESQSRRLPDL